MARRRVLGFYDLLEMRVRQHFCYHPLRQAQRSVPVETHMDNAKHRQEAMPLSRIANESH